MGHETNDLKAMEEYTDGLKYNGRTDLGNTQPGDGPRFIGRCPIHLTGRYNYAQAQKATGHPIEDFPEMAVLPSVAFDVTKWKWKDGFRIVQGKDIVSDTLNKFCDGTTYSYYLMTYAINGGLRGIEDRLRRWNKAITVRPLFIKVSMK